MRFPFNKIEKERGEEKESNIYQFELRAERKQKEQNFVVFRSNEKKNEEIISAFRLAAKINQFTFLCSR